MSAPSTSYVPLWCKSNYSFLEGASHPAELVETASQLGLPAMALTDRDGFYGLVKGHMRARELGLSLICGTQLTLADESQVVILVKDHQGYRNLCRLITTGRRRCEKGRSAVSVDEVCAAREGLVVMWGGDGTREPSPDPAHEGKRRDELALARQVHQLKEAFEHDLYLMLVRHQEAKEVRYEQDLLRWSRVYQLPLVATTEVLYHHRQRQPLQDVLTCIRHGKTLDRAGRILRPNAEHALIDPLLIRRRFSDHPQALANTLAIAEKCKFSLGQIRYRYPDEDLPNGMTAIRWLTELCARGLQWRYGEHPPEGALPQLARELALIQELDYAGYFLTMHELVVYCREHDILCQGRGSAANSIVCFLLGVTAVDPILLGFLFERFISRERAEPPDIDLDIEHERREEVIQHVYTRYGRERAAMVANVVRYRPRSAIREIAKALDLSESAIDRAAKLVDAFGSVSEEALTQAGLDLEEPRNRLLYRLSNELLDFPRHLSIHPGGFLLGHEPVCEIVPIENASMPARTVIQWDKDDVEALGLFKVDLLALGTLSHLHQTFDLIRQHRGESWTLATIPRTDAATFDMICAADTVGVFQIESRAQMSMLPRLRPRTFYDLVIEISIVRPGPISGGMVHPYLRRRRGEETILYPHPSLVPVLEKTLGVPLFQEQVMRLAMVAADYSPGEADQLRRDMAAWRQVGRLEGHRTRLISRMVEKGIDLHFAERVFEQIRGFGEYGFPESHAASFAILAYATAWLKCHYPCEFTCALLNAQPMGFYSPATIIHDARRHGVAFAPVDVNFSNYDHRIETLNLDDVQAQPGIRMGLREIRGFSAAQAQAIAEARERAPFQNLEDFIRRSQLDRRSLTNLARAGALQGFYRERRQALWHVQGALVQRHDTLLLPLDDSAPLLKPLARSETVVWDYIYSGHSIQDHPFAVLRPQLAQLGCLRADELEQARNNSRIRVAGMAICRQRPPTAGGVLFMTLEDESGVINVIVWPKVLERYHNVLRTSEVLLLHGQLQRQDGVTHVITEHVEPLQLGAVERAVPARNFR
jgi:error-prone DNA polymerase